MDDLKPASLEPWGHYLNGFGDFCVVICDGPDDNGMFEVWHSTYGSGSRSRPHYADGRVSFQTAKLNVNLSTFGGRLLDRDKPDLWPQCKRTRAALAATDAAAVREQALREVLRRLETLRASRDLSPTGYKEIIRGRIEGEQAAYGHVGHLILALIAQPAKDAE